MKKSGKALLIIDIQEDFTGDNAKMPVDREQAAAMIVNINNLLGKAEGLAITPVYIGNEYAPRDFTNIFRNHAAIKDTPGVKPDGRLKIASDHYFPKHKNNAFTNPELDRFLKQHNISELYLCGIFAEACIYATTKGAIKNQYTVNVLTDCLAAKSDKRLERMMAKYKKLEVNCLTTDELYQSIL